MSRIPTPTVDHAPADAQPLLAGVQKQLGTVPNMFRLISNSPAALEAYLGFSGSLGKGKLAPATRERIALAVAEVNGCNYCLSAHTYIGLNLTKLDVAEITANRSGASNDLIADAAVRFAAKVAKQRGQIDNGDIVSLRQAGYSDGEILEIIGHVALNVFTNYVNEALKTEIDFPRVDARKAA